MWHIIVLPFLLLLLSSFPEAAMFQIISPLVAKALNDKDDLILLQLLKKKSANNLLLVSGLLFLLINLNLNDFYAWTNLGDYTVALEVVLIVSVGKLFTMSMGCLNNIITNSKYYAYVFWFRLALPFWPYYSTFISFHSMGLLEQPMQH